MKILAIFTTKALYIMKKGVKNPLENYQITTLLTNFN